METELMNTRLTKRNIYTKNDLCGIAKKCDWFVHYNNFVNVQEVNQPRTVFLHNFQGEITLKYFVNDILPRIKQPFILIIASEDYTFPTGSGDKRANFFANQQHNVEALINCEYIIHIYVENLDKLHVKMSPLPLGFPIYGNYNQPQYKPVRNIQFNNADLKAYCIHRIHDGHPQWQERRNVENLCTNQWKNFTTYQSAGISQTCMLDKMKRHAFTICVHGGGIDPSPKCAEAILCGSIPILKHSTLDAAYSQLPVVYIDGEWDETAITETKMKEWLIKLRCFYEDKEEREKVIEMLTLDYWWDKVIMHHYHDYMNKLKL